MPANPSPKRKTTIRKVASAESPSAKDFFRARTVRHVLDYMLEGSPRTQVAWYGALEALSAVNASNVAIMLVKTVVNCGNGDGKDRRLRPESACPAAGKQAMTAFTYSIIELVLSHKDLLIIFNLYTDPI
jgi:hypothetical protein